MRTETMATHVDGGNKTIANLTALHASPINLLTKWHCTAVQSPRDHFIELIFNIIDYIYIVNIIHVFSSTFICPSFWCICTTVSFCWKMWSSQVP